MRLSKLISAIRALPEKKLGKLMEILAEEDSKENEESASVEVDEVETAEDTTTPEEEGEVVEEENTETEEVETEDGEEVDGATEEESFSAEEESDATGEEPASAEEEVANEEVEETEDDDLVFDKTKTEPEEAGFEGEEVAEEQGEEMQAEEPANVVDDNGEELPVDYNQIIDGLNAKILALESENKTLRAKCDGAFGLMSKPNANVKANRLYDEDTSDLVMRKI